MKTHEYLRETRLKKKLSQAKVAEAAGVGLSYLSAIELGRAKLSFAVLVRLYKAMEMWGELPKLVFSLSKDNQELPVSVITKLLQEEHMVMELIDDCMKPIASAVEF